MDQEILDRTQPGAPQRKIFAPAGWEHREGVTQEVGSAFFDDDLVVPDARKHWTPNFSAAILQPDGRTIENIEPICRPREGSEVWGYRFERTDLFGDGIKGSHGGSGMTALGGAIRRGELLTDDPLRHALKVCLFCEKYSYYGPDRAGFRWPAERADNYAATGYKGTNKSIGMGTLLCLKPDVDLAALGLQTSPGRKITRALQDYGAYVVDDAAHDVFYFCAERGVREEVSEVLGVEMDSESGAYFEDIAKLVPLLQVVDNNAPATIGGGGKRRAPLAPPLTQTIANPLEPHPGPNLVPNGTMELGQDAPDGWGITSEEGGKAALKRETAAPFKGQASLRVTSPGKAMARIQLPGEIKARSLELTGHVSAKGSANAMLGIMCYTSDWKGLNFLVAGNSVAGAGWTTVFKKLELPEGTAHVDVSLLIEGEGSGLLDEVTVRGGEGDPKPAVEAKQAPPKAENAWLPAPGFYPDYPEAWMNFHGSLKEQASKGGVDLLFIGDSLTMGWDKELWEKNFSPLKAANFGVGGDGTPQLLWRLENGGFDGLQPKVVVLMIGINNVWPGFSAADTAKGIRTFVDKLREKMPASKILLMGVLPAFDENDSIRNYVTTVNRDIAELADGKTVRFLDFGKDLLTPDGRRRDGFYTDDRLHLKKPAYEVWEKAMAPVLSDLISARR
ncbi:MAG: hypothetical protein EOP88_15245 [Verrucomicrobiaceae bacterium]|nr:MAG: hypothetical protein EOP88_15245 [Verrucomicrobiaceae bacterium]